MHLQGEAAVGGVAVEMLRQTAELDVLLPQRVDLRRVYRSIEIRTYYPHIIGAVSTPGRAGEGRCPENVRLGDALVWLLVTPRLGTASSGLPIWGVRHRPVCLANPTDQYMTS